MSAVDVPGVHAVVVNWNGGERNLACVDSLVVAGIDEGRIVFVDNGSEDGSLEALRRHRPGVSVVANGENLGFGEGANQGARLALERGAELVFFVNNDVTMRPGTPLELVAELERAPALGVVGPRVLLPGEPARVWCAGGMLTWRQNLSTLLGHGEPDGPRWQEDRDVDYVAGCAMLVRRAVFEAIGFLDASYFAYTEDVEFCLRARAAGFGVRTIGRVACVHAPSSATGGGYNPRRKYMQGVNSVHFLRRHGGMAQWMRFLVFDVATLPPLFVAGLARGRARAVAAKALGIAHGLLGRRVRAERLREGGTWLW